MAEAQATHGHPEAGGVKSSDFRVQCPCRKMYLLLSDTSGMKPMLEEMTPDSRDWWAVRLLLLPGVYRYRYYADFGDLVTYVSPTEVGDESVEQMLGLDAVRVIQPDRQFVN